MSTTVVLVGEGAADALRPLERLPNVRARSLDGWGDDEAARWGRGGSTPYVVHDRDPLVHVAAAWEEFYDDLVTLETLTLEVDRAIDALAGGRVMIPDYYVVLEPESFAVTRRHWWLGVVSSASPQRVIPWPDRETQITRLLRRLPAGRPWPAPEAWLRKVPTVVPDRAGLS
ncbi:MAG: hypothetical protein HY996_05870 [Micrococcales bacterium]|nr:hypothetical protein [Micrococcales bacterium]